MRDATTFDERTKREIVDIAMSDPLLRDSIEDEIAAVRPDSLVFRMELAHPRLGRVSLTYSQAVEIWEAIRAARERLIQQAERLAREA